ncbi:MAG TPA: type II secretion system major pseudopilin GspG [Candidatus Binatia bacterium]|nr:type II secretion system major pseudopilin GspG [Candidatus Binatia bacterium]
MTPYVSIPLGRTARRTLIVVAIAEAAVFLILLTVARFMSVGHKAERRAALALDAFHADVGRYPTTGEGLQALVQRLQGVDGWDRPYVESIPLDPWHHPYAYRAPGGEGRFRDIVSFGGDGAKGGVREGADIVPFVFDAWPGIGAGLMVVFVALAASRPTEFQRSHPIMRENRRQAGFTLIELMIVMSIIALLMALVVPRFMGQQAKAERRAARAQIELFGTALDAFRLDIGRYPTGQEGLAALVQRPFGVDRWDGPYLKKQVPLDPWHHPYEYRSPGQGGRPYDIVSYGADGAPGGDGDGRDIASWENDAG